MLPRLSALSLSALTLLSLLFACSGGDDSDSRGSGDSDDSTTADSMAGVNAMAMELEEEDVENYLAAMKELMSSGSDLKSSMGEDPSAFQQFAAGLSFNDDWQDIIDDHDMDQTEFMKTHYNVMMAFAAEKMEEARAGMDKGMKDQLANLEKMKETMGEDAVNKMMEGMKQAQTQFDAMYESVPTANKELVAKFKEQIESIFK